MPSDGGDGGDAAAVVTAEVAVGLPLRSTFHYRVPEVWSDLVRRGSIVRVPFGPRQLTGYVLALAPPPAEAPAELKAIHEVLEPGGAIDDDLFALAEFVADYYRASLGEVLRVALPSSSLRSVHRVELSAAGREALAGDRLKPGDRALLAALAEHGVLSPGAAGRLGNVSSAAARLRRLENEGLVHRDLRVRPVARTRLRRRIERSGAATQSEREAAIGRSAVKRRLVELLERAGGPVAWAEARAESRATARHLAELEQAKCVRSEWVEVSRDLEARPASSRRLSDLSLTSDQRQAVAEVVASLDRGGFAPFLLHGVTASGKTLVYLGAMAEALRRGRSALMLVPEIALTPVLGRELRGRFGDEVAVLHSGLAPGERYDAWRRVLGGEARVVFGARSAVFAPARNLGLIVVDEEHDPSYKQDDRPHYHARDVAVARAKLLGIPVLLGSATPSLESGRNAELGRYRRLSLPGRVAGQQLPEVEVVDMRDEFEREGGVVVLSERLVEELEATLGRGEQAVLLLNRRGYASFLLCRECGQRAECPNCSVCLTFHRREMRLKCHHCDHQEAPPQACPGCGGVFLHLVGYGTEKVEAAVRERLPRARIARLDRDAARGRGEVETILAEFEAGAIDILVGTQMVAKGHDFPRVTLVGVVSVDAMLALPDFRATERAFALLTQVAGRAGRGDRPGRVLLQTHHPDNEAVRLACAQDQASFYRREMKLRRLMRYPPESHLVNLMVRGSDRARVQSEAGRVAVLLRRCPEPGARILGPAMAPVERLKRAFRAQILVKGRTRAVIRRVLAAAEPELSRSVERGGLDVDVDPQDLL